jgi:hypothetical protein
LTSIVRYTYTVLVRLGNLLIIYTAS